jgi:hypothetical protein
MKDERIVNRTFGNARKKKGEFPHTAWRFIEENGAWA